MSCSFVQLCMLKKDTSAHYQRNCPGDCLRSSVEVHIHALKVCSRKEANIKLSADLQRGIR